MTPIGIVVIAVSLLWGALTIAGAMLRGGIASIPDMMIGGTLFLAGCVLLGSGRVVDTLRDIKFEIEKTRSESLKPMRDQISQAGGASRRIGLDERGTTTDAAMQSRQVGSSAAHAADDELASKIVHARSELFKAGVSFVQVGPGHNIKTPAGMSYSAPHQKRFDELVLMLVDKLRRGEPV